MNKLIKLAKIGMIKDLGKAKCQDILKLTKIRYNELLLENKDANKLTMKHYKQNIFPAIALYDSIIKVGFNTDTAVLIVGNAKNELSNKERKSMISMMKIPFLYKLYPTIFKKMQMKVFNKKAGFDYEYIDDSKNRCKFNMTKCLYYDTFKRYNCPNLTGYFCHSDILKNDGIHKKLIWHRDGTIGQGQELCDFEIRIEE